MPVCLSRGINADQHINGQSFNWTCCEQTKKKIKKKIKDNKFRSEFYEIFPIQCVDLTEIELNFHFYLFSSILLNVIDLLIQYMWMYNNEFGWYHTIPLTRQICVCSLHFEHDEQKRVSMRIIAMASSTCCQLNWFRITFCKANPSKTKHKKKKKKKNAKRNKKRII